MQAEVNIGMLGHVDHGKTTLTQAITGKWTDTHSEEIKRGISIRVGYAEAPVYHCTDCDRSAFGPQCPGCGKKAAFRRKISFLDAPGHETLMTAVIAASSLLDGALFLIASNEPCPQPQTAEHLMILNLLQLKNVVVVQTKTDLISREQALENHKQIRAFLKGSVVENAPIVPVSATYKLNIGNLADMMERYIPTPARQPDAPLRMYVSRSFDVNRPGTPIAELRGGVLGGSVVQGTMKKGDKVEIRPGLLRKEGTLPTPIVGEVRTIHEEQEELEQAGAGGLIAMGTDLDPALAKADSLAGSIIGKPGGLPDATNTLQIRYSLIQRVDIENPLLKVGEPLAINVYTATTVGVIAQLNKGIATVRLKKPVVAEKGARIAISRRLGNRWRLGAWGTAV